MSRGPGAGSATSRKEPGIVAIDRPPTYEVQSGDTYQRISERFYRTTKKAHLLMEANPEIGEFDLMPKMVILVPPDPDPVPEATTGPATTGAPPGRDVSLATTRSPGTTVGGADTPPAAVGRLYEVKRDDTYERISQEQYGSRRYARLLIEANGIDPYDLRPGQKLRIPDVKVEKPAPAGSGRTIPAGARTHTLRAGEYLGDVARRYLGSSDRWREIADLNRITNPKRVPAGMTLVLPEAAAAPTEPAGGGAPPVAAGADVRMVTVQPGDTYQRIAKREYGGFSKYPILVKANPEYPPRSLPVGAQIRVPRLADTEPSREPESEPEPSRRGAGGPSLSGSGTAPRRGEMFEEDEDEEPATGGRSLWYRPDGDGR